MLRDIKKIMKIVNIDGRVTIATFDTTWTELEDFGGLLRVEMKQSQVLVNRKSCLKKIAATLAGILARS